MKKTPHQPIAIATFWFACWTVATLSLLPVNDLPSITLGLWDKAQHACGFFVLGLLGLWAYPKHISRVHIGLLLFGAMIEVAQSISGWRTGDPIDWLADVMGITLAQVVTWGIPRCRAKHKTR